MKGVIGKKGGGDAVTRKVSSRYEDSHSHAQLCR